MLSPDMGNNPAAWVKLARSLGLRAWSTPDGRYLHLALEECDICGGRGMVQLPVRIPLSRIDFSAGAISYDAAQTSRMLPCPQCFGPKAEMPKGWESPPAD